MPGKVYTFNSTELRAIGDDIEMRPLGVGGAPLDVVQREARAVPVRAAAQRADEARRVNGLVYRAQAQRAPPPEQLLELSQGSFHLDPRASSSTAASDEQRDVECVLAENAVRGS